MERLVLNLAANEGRRLPYAGNRIRVESATGSVQIRASGKHNGRPLELGGTVLSGGKAIDYGALPYDEFVIEDKTGNANAVVLVVGFGKVEDQAITGLIDVDSNDGFTAAAADVAVPAAGGVATLLLAANANRKCVRLHNLQASADVLRLPGTNQAFARGDGIAPGMSVLIENKGAIYGYSVGGCTVGVLEEI